jgi:hypothetical protein
MIFFYIRFLDCSTGKCCPQGPPPRPLFQTMCFCVSKFKNILCWCLNKHRCDFVCLFSSLSFLFLLTFLHHCLCLFTLFFFSFLFFFWYSGAGGSSIFGGLNIQAFYLVLLNDFLCLLYHLAFHIFWMLMWFLLVYFLW